MYFRFIRLAQVVKLMIALGVLLGYSIQFFVAIQIMLPSVNSSVKLVRDHPYTGEFVFRTFMVLVTFSVAVLIPQLDLLLSLIGAVCSTVLALVFPPIMEIIIMPCDPSRTRFLIIFKNSIILILAFLGFLTGGYESISAIVKTFFID